MLTIWLRHTRNGVIMFGFNSPIHTPHTTVRGRVFRWAHSFYGHDNTLRVPLLSLYSYTHDAIVHSWLDATTARWNSSVPSSYASVSTKICPPGPPTRAHHNSSQLAMILRYAPTNHKYTILVVHTQHVNANRGAECESCGMWNWCVYTWCWVGAPSVGGRTLSTELVKRYGGVVLPLGNGSLAVSCCGERWEMFTVDTAKVCVCLLTLCTRDADHEMSPLPASGVRDAAKRGDVFMRQATHTCPGSVSIIYFRLVRTRWMDRETPGDGK